MKILHIIASLPVGGTEMVLKRLIESDPVSIPKTVVVSLTPPLGIIGESLCNQGVKVHTLNLSSLGFNIPIVLWQLIKLIRHYQPEIVKTWMYHSNFLGGLAAYLSGYRNIVWGIHHTALSSSDSRRIIMIMKICAFLSRWIPKKIICVAEASKLAHITAGYDATRIVVIPNGFDFSQLTATHEQRLALRLACNFSESELVIGCVGRFHIDKGQDIFVKAAAIVVRYYPRTKFLLVGADCDINNVQLINQLNHDGLQESFVLLGERLDVPVCLAAMDVFCTQNFDTYEIPRFSTLPKIETVLVENRDLSPQGGGEPAITCVGAAIANAIFDATGARLFTMAMTPERVKEALKKV